MGATHAEWVFRVTRVIKHARKLLVWVTNAQSVSRVIEHVQYMLVEVMHAQWILKFLE